MDTESPLKYNSVWNNLCFVSPCNQPSLRWRQHINTSANCSISTNVFLRSRSMNTDVQKMWQHRCAKRRVKQMGFQFSELYKPKVCNNVITSKCIVKVCALKCFGLGPIANNRPYWNFNGMTIWSYCNFIEISMNLQ